MARVIDIETGLADRTVPTALPPDGLAMAKVVQVMASQDRHQLHAFVEMVMALSTLPTTTMEAITQVARGRPAFTPDEACKEVKITAMALIAVLRRAPLELHQVTKIEEVAFVIRQLYPDAPTVQLPRTAAALMRGAHMLPDSPALDAWFATAGDTVSELRDGAATPSSAWTTLGQFAGSLGRVVLTHFHL